MNRGPQFAVCAVALLFAVTVGCTKKQPQLPSQAKAPAEVITTPLPAEISETPPPPPPQTPEPQPQSAEPVVTKLPKKRPRKKIVPPAASVQAANPTNAQTSSTSTPTTGAPATTPPAGGTTTVAAAHAPANPAVEASPDPAITPDVSSAQLIRQKQSTAQLLEDTEKTINGVKAQNHAEEETLAEIRSYVNQSRKATSEGDFERAYNLATKAHLLSDALVKK